MNKKPHPEPPAFRARDWQKRAVSVCRTVALNKMDRALIYACPGSGKTYGGLLIAGDLASKGGKGRAPIKLRPGDVVRHVGAPHEMTVVEPGGGHVGLAHPSGAWAGTYPRQHLELVRRGVVIPDPNEARP